MIDAIEHALPAKAGTNKYLFLASALDFKKIPGALIAYWLPSKVGEVFENYSSLGDILISREGLTTGDNSRFLRNWSEVARTEICLDAKSECGALRSGRRWFPHLKGGEYRKWAGNHDYVVDWMNDGADVRNLSDPSTGRIRSHNYNGIWAFKEGITWSSVSSGSFCVRHVSGGFMFDTTGTMAFLKEDGKLAEVEGFLNSKVASYLMEILAPTIRFQPGHALNLPYRIPESRDMGVYVDGCIQLSLQDWNLYEHSWDFTCAPVLLPEHRKRTLHATYGEMRSYWRDMTIELRRLEQENNRIFIETYGLEDELKAEVPLEEITLTCNPHYRYGGDKTDEELEALLLADTMREFISYAVGCMFGRYSLDKPGLVLANQGDALADYLRQVPQPTFTPDADNVIPLLDGEWFNDDITERFRSFLRLTFGEAHYAENLKFIEDALGKDLRKFFLKDFYTDHVKRYKKRPIYWLFSSPKGSFNALIYLHRYRPDTTSVVLQYLRDFQEKLAGERKRQEQISISASASQADKTRALKSIDSLKKTLTELDDYERDVLHPLATQQIAIDLDDGVKVNYLKLGAALKKISGLEAKEEE